ncbi:MAG: hypothetical protein R3C01_14910 [Planctomycetaceae bacterium]
MTNTSAASADNDKKPSIGLWLLAGVSVLILFLVIVPFRKKSPDVSAGYDRQVEEQWLSRYQQVDPIEFLEKGGVYNYEPDEWEENYDITFFLPLLKRLRDEEGLKPIGLVDPAAPAKLYAVIAELPGEPGIKARLEAIFNDEESRFEGAIQDRIGHRWLDLEYFEPDDDGYAQWVRDNDDR